MFSLYFTSHALSRMLERNFSKSLVAAIIAHGDSSVADLDAFRYTVSPSSLRNAPFGTFSVADIGKTVILSRSPLADGSLKVITLFQAAPPPSPSVRFTSYQRRQRSKYHRKSRRG